MWGYFLDQKRRWPGRAAKMLRGRWLWTLSCLLLVGCPLVTALPYLWVSHTAINFGVSKQQESILLRNAGGGTLNWTIAVLFTNPAAPPASWLSVDTAAGATTTETELVTVTVDRGTLASGTYNATLRITPDVGVVGTGSEVSR